MKSYQGFELLAPKAVLPSNLAERVETIEVMKNNYRVTLKEGWDFPKGLPKARTYERTAMFSQNPAHVTIYQIVVTSKRVNPPKNSIFKKVKKVFK